MKCRLCKTEMTMIEESFSCSKAREGGTTIRKYWCPACQADRVVKGGELSWDEIEPYKPMTDKEIEKLLEASPEIRLNFKRDQENFLLSIRKKFQITIAGGDFVELYLLRKAIEEILILQAVLEKNHYNHLNRMRALKINDKEKETVHLRYFLKRSLKDLQK